MADYSGGGWGALAQSTAHLPALGMGLMELKDRQLTRDANVKMHQEQIAIQQEEEKRKAAAFQYAEEARKKQDAQNKAIVPASLVNPLIHEHPTQKAMLVDAAKAAGFNIRDEGGELYAPKEAFDYMGSLVKSGTEQSTQFIRAGRVDLQNKAQNLIQQVGELNEKTDEKSIQKKAELEKQLLNVKTQIAQTFDIEDKVMEQVQIAAGKPGKGEWSEPYNMGGAIVQKNSVTGEIRQAVGRPPAGEGATARVTKEDNIARRIEKDAADQARKEAFLKFNINPAITQNADGSINVQFPQGRPEVFQYYEKRRDELKQKGLSRAIKQGALSKDYLPETPEPPMPLGIDTEQGLREHLKRAGAQQGYIDDYVSKAKAAGKLK